MKDQVRILGARGSIPVSGRRFSLFGGATSCVLITLARKSLIIDAGTGLLSCPPVRAEDGRVPMLLSHPHADHMLGLSMSSFVMREGYPRLDVYAETHGGLSPFDQANHLFSPPVWPITPDAFPFPPVFHEIAGDFELGPLHISVMQGSHPGGVTLFRIESGGKSVVYASDCELKGDLFDRVAAFASGCSLLLCDGQYDEAESAIKAGFGHNSYLTAAKLGSVCGAKETRIVHHDPQSRDRTLLKRESSLSRNYPRCLFAREGEVILL